VGFIPTDGVSNRGLKATATLIQSLRN